MRVLAWLVLSLVVSACTASNPRSCKDGLCTDQRFPFCDVDGAFDGTPQTCISVTCTPEEHADCRGDSDLVCNSTGNDYDIVSCPHGCDVDRGCRECTASEQCPTSRPICDSSGTCRTCVLDDECESRVCDAGTCVAQSGVIYAASGGANDPACSQSSPCSPGMAISKAASAAVTPLIRLLPGVYGFGLTVDVTTSSPLMIIATGATVAGDVALRVSSGVNVQVRGGAFVGSTYAVQCTSTGSLTSLQLADASLSASTENTTLVDVASCFVRAATSSFDATMINAAAILVESSGGFSGDRLRVHGNRAQPVTIGGTFVTRASVQITNSLLEDVYIDIYATDTTDPGSSLAFGNNTIVGSGVICRTGSGAAHLSTVFDNNIVSARVGANSIEPAPRCVFRNNVAYPQTTPLPGNIIGDPLFAAPLSGDYHVVNGSPAIDAAVATSSFPTFKPDLDGTARPRGAAPDIGAFER